MDWEGGGTQSRENESPQTTPVLIRYLVLYGTSPVAYCEFCQNLEGGIPPTLEELSEHRPLSSVYQSKGNSVMMHVRVHMDQDQGHVSINNQVNT